MEEPDNNTMLGAFLEGMRPKPTRIGLRDEGQGRSILGRRHRKYKGPEREKSWCDYSLGETQRSCNMVREPESGPKKLERSVQRQNTQFFVDHGKQHVC